MKVQALVLAAALLSSMGTVLAEDSRKEAEAHFRTGDRFFKAAQYREAAEAFQMAYDLLPLPAIAFSLAQAYRLHYARDEDPTALRRSVKLYRTYLDEEPRGKRAADATANLADLLPALSRLGSDRGVAIGARATKITVSADIEGAEGSVGDGPMRPLPFTEVVAPGTHRVRVTAVGYFPFEKTYTAIEGRVRPVEPDLRPKPAMAAIAARDGSQVRVDGRLVATTPLDAPLRLSPGAHFVSVTKNGRETFAAAIETKRGETTQLEADQPMTTQRLVSCAALGLGGALALGSGVYGLMALGSDRSADDLDTLRREQGLSPAQLAEFQGHVDDRDKRLGTAGALLGAGLAVAAGGTLLYFLDTPDEVEQPGAPRVPSSPSRTPLTRTRALPYVTPSGAGVALSGRF